MLRSRILLTFVGVSLVALSACAPRNSIMKAKQYPSDSQNVVSSKGVKTSRGLPLYQSAMLNRSAQSSILSDNLPSVDYRSTGTTKHVVDHNATGTINSTPVATGMPMGSIPNVVSSKEMIYHVQKGETIYSIARKFNAHPKHIIARNNMLSPNMLYVGQTLIMPKREILPSAAYDNSLYTGSIKQQSNHKVAPVYSVAPVAQPSIDIAPPYPKSKPNVKAVNYRYKIKAGDTIYSIGRKFNVHPDFIMQKNPHVIPSQLKPGQLLNMAAVDTTIIENSTSEKKQDAAKKAVKVISKTADVTPVKPKAPAKKAPSLKSKILANALELPVTGSIVENKNLRGILIAASDGAAVKASASGEVIYVGNLNNYGNMILVRHDNGLVTNYARLKKTFVQKGQKVNRGDLLASAGTSKDFQKSDVLFEVRKGTKAVNPLDYVG